MSVGDGTVNASRLKPYDNAFVITFNLADGHTLVPGIWTDQLRMREVEGRKLWVRTQSIGYFNGLVSNMVNMFDPATLASVSSILVNPDGSKERWTFHTDSADAQITAPDGKMTVTHIPLPKPAYDFACCMPSLMAMSLPRLPNRNYVFRTIPSHGDPDTEQLLVKGREKVHAGHAGLIDAWRVEYPDPGGGTVTFWVTDRPPYMVRMTLRGIPGNKNKNGVHYDQSFDMIGAPPPR